MANSEKRQVVLQKTCSLTQGNSKGRSAVSSLRLYLIHSLNIILPSYVRFCRLTLADMYKAEPNSTIYRNQKWFLHIIDKYQTVKK